MCGRFTQRYTWSEVLQFLRVFGPPRNLQPHYNIAPTMTVDVIRLDESGRRELVPMRWGLIPALWPKSLKEIPATFNARAESVADKPMFRDAFRGQRCIIPASGFYEWTGDKGNKQPHLFTAADGSPILAFAGLWDTGAIARPARMSCHARSSYAGPTSGCRPTTTACLSFWTRRISTAGLTVPLARMR
jgi:putative SOS response-associated peptidase YedK